MKEGCSLGKNQTVYRYLKRVFNKRPVVSKNVSTLTFGKVIKHLAGLSMSVPKNKDCNHFGSSIWIKG